MKNPPLQVKLATHRAAPDPVSRALASAPIDDEPETKHERAAVREADAWFAQHEAGIAHDEVKRQLGIE